MHLILKFHFVKVYYIFLNIAHHIKYISSSYRFSFEKTIINGNSTNKIPIVFVSENFLEKFTINIAISLDIIEAFNDLMFDKIKQNKKYFEITFDS